MDVRLLSGKTALVTGAASGIGRACARAFAERGASLALCDLDEAGLSTVTEELRSEGHEVIAARVDVARAEEVQEFAEAVHARVPAVDILVNNAGVALGGGFLDTSLEDWEWIVSINLGGVVNGCHYFVPRMVEAGRGGHVVNLSSAAGFVASDALPAYCTTKFAVLGLSEALGEELRHYGIGVTAVCPGLIDTPIARNARVRGELLSSAPVRDDMVRMLARRGYAPERVARHILKAIARNRRVAPITPEAWTLYYLKRLSPGLLRAITRLLDRRNRRRAGLAAGGGSRSPEP